MPYKDPIKAKEYAKKWFQEHKESSRKQRLKNVKRYYKRMRSDPEKEIKFKIARRKYYLKLKNEEPERYKKYWIASSNNARFGGLKYIVLERDNSQCRICSSTAGRIEVHHIDGKGRGFKNANNSMDNLIVLCNQCHTTIHKFAKIKHIELTHKLLSSLS